MSNYDTPSNNAPVYAQSLQSGNSTAPVLPAAPAPLAAGEERTWAALAHAASILSLASGGLFGPVASFVIWLVFRERSRFVAEQAMQSTVFQVVAFIVNAVVWGVTVALISIVVGICLLPFALLVTTASIVWPLVAAYDISQGRNFRYPIIADVVSGATQP